MSHHIHIRKGSIEEIISLTLKFPEFHSPYLHEEYIKRFKDVPFLILVAEAGGKLAGCKVGYERDNDGSFYSWIGGVLPSFRRLGIAQQLAKKQEEWAREQNYTKIRFKTRNCHTNMLLFALRRGFYIINFEPYPNHLESRIWLEREL